MPGDPAPDEAKLAVSTSHLLHRVQQLASDRFARLVGENGVTLRQFVVMATIADTPGMAQVDLVRATGIDRSTLGDMLTRLAKRGLIERGASKADARASAITLSKQGQAMLASVRQHARAADAAIVDALPRTKRKVFLALLSRLADEAEKIQRQAERDAKRRAEREAKRRRKEKKAEREKAAKPKRKSDAR